jgi:hypothetical protein
MFFYRLFSFENSVRLGEYFTGMSADSLWESRSFWIADPSANCGGLSDDFVSSG